MGQIVNLRQARKSKKRADRQRQAAENRVRFGRNKTERLKDEIEDARRHKSLDEKRLDTDPS